MKAFPGMDIRAEYKGSWDDKFLVPFTGMDLRDYFASKALQSLAAMAVENDQTPKNTAKICYMFADAMMEAKNA